jgi:hypothetical protein
MNARALFPAVIFLLAGCNGGPNVPYVGLGKLPLNVLAVTTVEPETNSVTSKTYVRWPGQLNAKTYEVIRKFGDNPAKVVASTDQTSYLDPTLSAGQSATYKVRVLSGVNAELNVSDDKPVTVLAQTIGKPDGLLPATNTTLGVGETPTFKWNAVPSATWYFVNVVRADTRASVYSALTKDTSVKFGDNSPLKFSNFGDLFPTAAPSSITAGIIFQWTVQAIRSDGGATPDDAKGIDVNTSAPFKFSQG